MSEAWIIERVMREQPAAAWRAVLWADVTVPQRRRWYAKPANWLSAYVDATAPQLADLRAGVLTEKVITLTYQSDPTFVDVRADIVAELGRFQQETDVRNVWNHYGTHYDGTTWDVITLNP